MSDLLKVRVGGSDYLCKWEDKGFVLDISNFDLTTLKQGDHQFYGFGLSKSLDNKKLILTGNSAFSIPLQDYHSYDFEMHYNIVSWNNYMYPASRLFAQLNSGEGFGACIIDPGTIIYIKPDASFIYGWYAWTHWSSCYNVPSLSSLSSDVKFKEECRGNNYKLYINDELILEYESQVDYNSLTGDENYNTSTANGLNKCGFILENGSVEITYFNLKKYS